MRPLPLFFGNDNSAVAQNFHMVRKRRLRNVEAVKNFASAKRAVKQHFKNFEPSVIPQRFENFNGMQVFHKNLILMFIDIILTLANRYVNKK